MKRHLIDDSCEESMVVFWQLGCNIKIMNNYYVTLNVFLRGPEIPEYIAKRVKDNERRYTTNNKVNSN